MSQIRVKAGSILRIGKKHPHGPCDVTVIAVEDTIVGRGARCKHKTLGGDCAEYGCPTGEFFVYDKDIQRVVKV